MTTDVLVRHVLAGVQKRFGRADFGTPPLPPVSAATSLTYDALPAAVSDPLVASLSLSYQATAVNSRDSLVSGTYQPNDPSVVGLLPGVALAPVYPPAGSQIIDLTSGATYTNQVFWGQVRPPDGGADITFRNCCFPGADPAGPLYSSASTTVGNIASFDSATVRRSKMIFWDCLISCEPWFTEAGLGRPLASNLTRTTHPLNAGYHGGNMELHRTEITHCQDGVNYTNGRDDTSCLIDASWIHRLYYQNGWTGPGSPISHDTHSDCFQFNRGKNITIQHSFLGGHRDQASYDIAPPGGFNGGDDCFGAPLMMKQEVGYTAYDQIHNVLIDHNWIFGGEYGLNMVYVSARPNLWNDCTIRNNIFSNQNPPENAGKYINKSTQLTPTITGNVVMETGATVVASNGGLGE